MSEILLCYILKSSLLCSIGVILILVLRKLLFNNYSHSFKYYIWLVVIIKLIIPFKIPIYISQNLYNIFFYGIDSESSIFINRNTLDIIGKSQKNIDYFKILFCLWLFGMLICLIYHTSVYLNFKNKIKYLSYNIWDSNIIGIYSDLLSELHIRKKITLKYCNGIDSPLGTGFFNKYILIPQNIYSADEIYWILKHELLHFKRYDMFYKFLLLIVMIMHWFNPLFYLMVKIINSDCELSCDETILENSNIESRKIYAIIFINSIKQSKQRNTKSILITNFKSNQNNIMKRRLENMLDLKIKRKGIILGIVAMLALSSSLININVFAKDRPKDDNATSTITETKISDELKTETKPIVTERNYSVEDMQKYVKEHPAELDQDDPANILNDYMKDNNLDHLTVSFTAPVINK